MWIRSQGKNSLINCRRITLVKPDKGVFLIVELTTGNYIELAEYKSKERAIEILNDIQSFVENNYISVDDMPSHDNSVYPSYYPRCFTMTQKKFFKMPEE